MERLQLGLRIFHIHVVRGNRLLVDLLHFGLVIRIVSLVFHNRFVPVAKHLRLEATDALLLYHLTDDLCRVGLLAIVIWNIVVRLLGQLGLRRHRCWYDRGLVDLAHLSDVLGATIDVEGASTVRAAGPLKLTLELVIIVVVVLVFVDRNVNVVIVIRHLVLLTFLFLLDGVTIRVNVHI